MNGHFFKHFNSRVDHQVVDGLWVLVARPHDSLELQSGVDELFGGLTENVLEDGAVVDYIEIDPVSLRINPDLKVAMHRLEL